MNHSIDEIEGVRKEMASLVEKLGSMLRGILSAKKEDVPEGGAVIEEEIVEGAVSAPEQISLSVKAESDGEVNKSEIVRSYFKRHGLETRNKDVVEGIKKESGVDVHASMVSFIKAQIAQKSASGKKEAPKKDAESKVWTGKAVSGSALIREYLEAHGLDASNDEVVSHIKKTKGASVKPTLVSSVRAALRRRGFKTSKVAAAKTESRRLTKRGPTMPSVVVEILKKAGKNGMELSEVTLQARKSGYQYRGNKGIAGFTQNVFQALHALSKKVAHPGFKGRTAVVIHEGRRYRLNPKAKFANNKVA